MIKHQKLFSRGFTLVELLVVIALIGIIMVPLVGFLGQLKSTYYSWETICRVNENRINILDQMACAIQESRILSTSTVQRIELFSGTDTIGYELLGGKILRYKNDLPQPLSENENRSLRFYYPQPSMVYINLDGYFIRVRSRAK